MKILLVVTALAFFCFVGLILGKLDRKRQEKEETERRKGTLSDFSDEDLYTLHKYSTPGGNHRSMIEEELVSRQVDRLILEVEREIVQKEQERLDAD